MARHLKLVTNRVATQATELATAVPQVLAYRLAGIPVPVTAPSAHDRGEIRFMGDDMLAVSTECWNTLAMHTLRASQVLALSFMRPYWFPWAAAGPSADSAALPSAVTGMVREGMAPMHRRAAANARRLGARLK